MEDEIAIYAPVFAYIGLGAGIFEFSKVRPPPPSPAHKIIFSSFRSSFLVLPANR